MQGLIRDMPLMISSAIRHAAGFHGRTAVVVLRWMGPAFTSGLVQRVAAGLGPTGVL
jgi:hypothetical protein